MATLYDGVPDARQAEEPITPSRFRPRYRQLSDGEKALHDAIKAKAEELERLYAEILKVRLAAGGQPSFVSRDGLPPPAPTRYQVKVTR